MTEMGKLTPFQQALLDSVLQEYQDIPAEEELTYEFSPEFQQWAETFVQEKTCRRFRVHAVIRKVLIAAIILLLLAGTAMAIPAVREEIVDFFTNHYEERIGIVFDPEEAATAPNMIETPYYIAGIPDGYVVAIDETALECVTRIWINENGQLITFMQYTVFSHPEADQWLGLDATDASSQTVLMEGYLVEMIETDENRKLIWTNNEYVFTLELPLSVTEDEMNRIFASWGPRT